MKKNNISFSNRLLEMNFMKDVAKEIKGDKTSDNDQNWEIDPGLGEVFDSMLEEKSFDMKKKPNEIVKKIFANARIRGKKQKKQMEAESKLKEMKDSEDINKRIQNYRKNKKKHKQIYNSIKK